MHSEGKQTNGAYSITDAWLVNMEITFTESKQNGNL